VWCALGCILKHDHDTGGVVPESLEHKCKCDWIENVAHTVKATVQKNPG